MRILSSIFVLASLFPYFATSINSGVSFAIDIGVVENVKNVAVPMVTKLINSMVFPDIDEDGFEVRNVKANIDSISPDDISLGMESADNSIQMGVTHVAMTMEGDFKYKWLFITCSGHFKATVKEGISTLFATRGSVMLTAGDEGGRSQHGNNNAYCQDNEITWMDWKLLDAELIAHTGFVASLRRRFSVFSEMTFFSGNGDVEWISLAGEPMTTGEWENPSQSTLGMLLATRDRTSRKDTRLAVLFNRSEQRQLFILPSTGEPAWKQLSPDGPKKVGGRATVDARSVAFFVEN